MFKAEEQVICVRARNARQSSGVCHLTKGKVYTVLVSGTRPHQIQIVNDQGDPTFYGSARFQSVDKVYGV